MERITALDFQILDWIQTHLTTPALDALMKLVTALGEGGAVWLLAAAVLLWKPKTRRQGVVVAVSLLLCLLVGNFTLKPLVARPRPFHIRPDFPLLIAPPGEFSFPSGHTMSSFAGAYSLFLLNKKWGIPALVLAAAIGFSRLYLYVHFPTDVLAGALLGLLAAWVCVTAARKTGFLSSEEEVSQ